jgi:ABC-2 type transport system ATP-binding protein
VIVQTINLTKRYGKLVALNNLNLAIEEGRVFRVHRTQRRRENDDRSASWRRCFSPRGARRGCADTWWATSPARSARLIGYVPDFFGAYEDMVVQEYLEFFASAYNIVGQKRQRIVADVLELTDLTHKQDALVDSLSRGMKQRLSIARVLLHDPRLLLLDEPASGLDPRARIEIRELLKELHRMGKTILISSHILPELADLCTSIGILEQGELVFQGSVREALRRAQTGAVVRVVTPDDQQTAERVLAALPHVESVRARDGELVLTLDTETNDFSFIAEAMLAHRLRILEIKREEVDLETAFMRLTKGAVQ